jgi:hypothetical protein
VATVHSLRTDGYPSKYAAQLAGFHYQINMIIFMCTKVRNRILEILCARDKCSRWVLINVENFFRMKPRCRLVIW